MVRGQGDSGGLGGPDVRAGRDALLAGRDLNLTYVFHERSGTQEAARAGELRPYLELLAGSYQWLELQGIREAGSLRIELEKVYVALKAEPETEYDLRHLANLHAIEVREAAGGAALESIEPARLAELDAENVRHTYQPIRDEAKRASVTEVTTIAHAFRTHHRMVLLGGPGSGKTTLGHWLALQLARGMLAQLPREAGPETAMPVRIRVPVAQVDPDHHGTDGDGQLVDLGPARVPIFLRLAHFARELAERERGQQPSLSLEEYLGRDPDSCGRADGCTPESRNALLCELLEAGQAVVILDGLDELSEVNRRTVTLKIQDLIERFTTPNTAEESEVPWQAGGNQVIVTSRYVGYKLMPIRSGCVHFGIQAMRRTAVERFARSWAAAVNAELGADVRGPLAAEALIDEIYDDARPAIRELATNPLLITILATVYWADGRLPDQRAGVYDRVVENLLRIWLNRPECRAHALEREELLAALEPMAADMQGNRASNGLIGLDRIGELIAGPLALMRGSAPTDRSFKPVLDALLTTIRTHVGLLAEQSAGNYAFFHRTFQEFLAARYLLSDRADAAAKIVERLDDPQWREPLLLALGLAMISPEWGGPRTRAQLLEDVLAGDDRDPLIPRGAMLVVSALPDLTNVPRPIIGQMVGQLLKSYALSQDQPQAEGLREGIREAFARLRDGPQADVVCEVIAEMIRRPAGDRDYAAAAADVLLRIDWFTTETVDALLHVAHREQAGLGWPVHWALLAALGQPAGDLPWSKPLPVLNRPRLAATHLPMRRTLESNPNLTAFIQHDAGWIWLMIALYGGIGHTRAGERLRAYQLECLSRARSGGEPPGPPPPAPPVEFCPGDIVHDLADAELSRAVARHLRARKPAGDLAGTFRRAWERGCAEGVVGLAALGEDVVPLVRDALADRDRQPAAQAVLGHFRWLAALLREPLLRSTETAARTLPHQAPQEHQLDLLRVVITARAASGGGPLGAGDMLPATRFVAATSAAVRDCLDAEYWAYLFSGLSATATEIPECPPERLIRGWPELSRARNLLAQPRLLWPQVNLPPRCDTPAGRYLAMLDGLAESPPELDFLAGSLLGRCRPLLDGHPSLIWETLAVCCSRGAGFMKGYLAGVTRGRVLTSAVESVAHDLASAWDQPDAEGLGRMLAGLFQWQVGGGREEADGVLQTYAEALLQASRIPDPYLRFRALWRLVLVVSRMKVMPLGLDLLRVVKEIADPHDRACALEWIMTAIPDNRLDLRVSDIFDLDGLVAAFGQIEDPENRARAQCRLAFLAPERLEDLLGAASGSVSEIADPRRRAEVIGDIRATAVGVPVPALDSLADALPDPWLWDKAHGRMSRLVAAYQHSYASGALAWRFARDDYRCPYPTGELAWGVVYLNAVAAEVGALEASPSGSEADWELLLGPEPRSGVDALVESAAEGGLRVSAREAAVLGRVIQSGRPEILRPLWAYLESPDAGAMAMMARWNAGDTETERWQALVQAEAGALTAQNISRVVELATTATDRLRLRAVLALHGRTPNTNNRNRRWSVARVGADAVTAAAELATRGDHPPSVGTTFGWIGHDIRHDDGEALGHWLSEAARDDDSPAHWILRHIESIDEGLVPVLLDALPPATAKLQQSLQVALARLVYCTSVLTGSQDALRAAAGAVPREIRRKLRVVPEGPVAYLKAAAKAVAEPGEDARVAVASSLIEQMMIWLDDECLSEPAPCLTRLRRIGRELYVRYGPSGDWEKADEAAAPLAENEDALRLLLSWTESLSFAESRDEHISDLLTALEAVARISPNAFTALADPDIWEPILTECVETADAWPARMACVRLLGLLRRVTERVAVALRAAMNDVTHVQQAAYQSIGEFRRMKGDIIPELLDLLGDPSACVAASTARLLVSLARGEGATADRRRVLRGLQDAVTGSHLAGPVYLMEEDEDNWALSIRFIDRLDRILYRAIFEVSGL